MSAAVVLMAYGSPVGDSLWKLNDHSLMPAASATKRDVPSSCDLYGSPVA